jgi:tetratricopeptide (TPR) repeat protein
LALWFFVILAPTSSFIPLATEIAAERRLYLPAIAVVVFVVVSAAHLLRRYRAAGVGLTVAVAGLFGWLTWQRNKDYESGLAIWSDAVKKAPQNPRAHNNLGNALQAAGRPAEAERHYREALRLDPHDWRAWYNFAGLLAKQDKLAEAVEYYRRAVEINPTDTDALVNVGVALGRLGEFEKALVFFAEAARLEPGLVTAHYNMGFTLLKMNRPAEAAPHFRRALELQPDSAAIRHGLQQAEGR